MIGTRRQVLQGAAAITDQMWSDAARKHFEGKIVVGKDLLEI